GMDVVAEGIEAEAQADRLVQFGCSGGQDFLCGLPCNADETLGYLRQNSWFPAQHKQIICSTRSEAFSAFAGRPLCGRPG
ncbi:hypothetical protein R0J91_19450, partial [Micrococcus sp. SIMBA_131]